MFRLTFEFKTTDDAGALLESSLPFTMRLSHRVVDVELESEEEAETTRATARRLGGTEVQC